MKVLVRVFISSIQLFCSSTVLASSEFEHISKLIHASIFEQNPNWKCFIAQQQVCSPQGCMLSNPTVWIQLSKISNNAISYKRCDPKGCDEYSADFNKSGIYTSISLPNNATILKVTNDGSEFTEVTMAGTNAFIGFGKCIINKQ